MAKRYWIAILDVEYPQAFDDYMRFIQTYVPSQGGTFLVGGDEGVLKEGEMRSRKVVIEWPSYDVALKAYDTPRYREGMKLRLGSAQTDLVIVEGA